MIDELVNWYEHRDGACWFTIVPLLFENNLEYPNLFYARMSRDSTAYGSYLHDLAGTVFTNHNDTVTSELEARRLNAIQELHQSKIEQAFRYLHQMAIDSLRAIKVRYID